MMQNTVQTCFGHFPFGGVVSTAKAGLDWSGGECCGHGTSTGIGCRSTGHELLPLTCREPGNSSSGGLLCSAVVSEAGF